MSVLPLTSPPHSETTAPPPGPLLVLTDLSQLTDGRPEFLHGALIGSAWVAAATLNYACISQSTTCELLVLRVSVGRRIAYPRATWRLSICKCSARKCACSGCDRCAKQDSGRVGSARARCQLRFIDLFGNWARALRERERLVGCRIPARGEPSSYRIPSTNTAPTPWPRTTPKHGIARIAGSSA